MKTLILTGMLLTSVTCRAQETKGLESIMGAESYKKVAVEYMERNRAVFFASPEEKEVKAKEAETYREIKEAAYIQMYHALSRYVEAADTNPPPPSPTRSRTSEEQKTFHDTNFHFRKDGLVGGTQGAIDFQVAVEFLRKAIAAREDAWHDWYFASPDEKPEKRRQYEKHCDYASFMVRAIAEAASVWEKRDRIWYKRRTPPQ